MPHSSPSQPTADASLKFTCGKTMKNRFMLAPLTNKQSHQDGRLSDGEFHWLAMRAQGQFGAVMTCATSVQATGKCWSGQLGIHADVHLPGHQKLTAYVKSQGSLVLTQLHHGGMRCPEKYAGGQPVCPSANEKHHARALTADEIVALREDFITAAVRAQTAGYDGVEIHGAHGYLLAQFLSAEINHRTDAYGGNPENRARILFEIVEGVRTACGPEFLLGVRLSPERFGMELDQVKVVCQRLIDGGQIDFLDISLWDVFKQPQGAADDAPRLLSHFTALDRKNVRLTVAGKISGTAEVNATLRAGVDFVSIGTSAILHHDFPKQVRQHPDFRPAPLPVSADYLRSEGLSEPFVNYMRKWPDFVRAEE
ncbi:MAG: NADH:flavin oxidoreductase [Bacteroidota bacterium]